MTDQTAPSQQVAIRTNVLAIVSIVAAFFAPPAAIITGHLALSQIRRTGEEGYMLAKAGLIVGYVFTSFYLLFFAIWLTMMITMFANFPVAPFGPNR